MGNELLDDIARRANRSIEQVADELVDASEAELDERVRALELLRRRVEAELAVTVAAAERRRVYLADGHRNMKGYLRATCNRSNADVAAQLRLSKATDHVPGLTEAFHTGRITRRSTTRRDIHGQRYTVRPDGSIILPVGARPPTFPSELDEPSDDDAAARDAIEAAELARIARARVHRLRRAA